MFTQPGHGAGKVAVAFPSDAVIVLFNPSVEFPMIPVPVKMGGGAVKVSVPVVGRTGTDPVALDDFDVPVDDFDVPVDDFEPLADVDVGEVVNEPVIFVSWKFDEKATFFEPKESKRIR
jgi:hypothetical protein